MILIDEPKNIILYCDEQTTEKQFEIRLKRKRLNPILNRKAIMMVF